MNLNKYILLAISLFMALSGYSQQKKHTNIKVDSLITNSGVHFFKGQTIQLGNGSGNNGSFESMFTSGLNWNGFLDKEYNNVGATKILNNESVKIIEIRRFEKKETVRYLIKIEYGFSKYWCDPEKGLESGEIIKPKTL